MSSQERSQEFLRFSSQFKLGALTTEASHPASANLSEVAEESIPDALKVLFEADRDVIKKFREFATSGVATGVAGTIIQSLANGGRIFFTGCGSTGRLSIQLASIWRDFWQQERERGRVDRTGCEDLENRALSVMAGGDFALIKSVEGFEDFTQFGRKQIAELGVGEKDVVFAITEGGETSFVIGTAWEAVDKGAKVYFVYNNPDDILCEHVERSREIIQDSRVEKINLTTGPMAITGSTRMQATSIQLCVMLTVLEIAARKLLSRNAPSRQESTVSEDVAAVFLAGLEAMHATLLSQPVLSQLSQAVSLEETVYRSARRNNYFADRFGIDVLTDTTERSPTYCVPPFRKFDDSSASESWAYLFVPANDSETAWRRILKREPRCIGWSPAEAEAMVPPDKAARTRETLSKITTPELMRFRIGMDGLNNRRPRPGDSAVAIVSGSEADALRIPGNFYREQLAESRRAGARTGLICLGTADELARAVEAVRSEPPLDILVMVTVPDTGLLLDGVARVGLKLLLNALSTCTMVRLGRVMGNYMVWVVPSNLKLIDRATRYIEKLAGLDYTTANGVLFDTIEYVEPRMKADQAYPPVVQLSVLKARHGIGNQEAEQLIIKTLYTQKGLC